MNMHWLELLWWEHYSHLRISGDSRLKSALRPIGQHFTCLQRKNSNCKLPSVMIESIKKPSSGSLFAYRKYETCKKNTQVIEITYVSDQQLFIKKHRIKKIIPSRLKFEFQNETRTRDADGSTSYERVICSPIWKLKFVKDKETRSQKIRSYLLLMKNAFK